MENNHAELRALAEKATKGPWHALDELGKSAGDHGFRAVVKPHRVSDRQYVYAEAANMWAGGDYGYKWGDDIAYIAAANPTAVLELLAEIEALRGALKHIVDTFDDSWLLGSLERTTGNNARAALKLSKD
jgi:hypothetical protein